MWVYFGTFLAYLFGFITIILTTIYIYFKYKFSYWEKENVLHLKPTFPFGNAKSFIFMEHSFGNFFFNLYLKVKKLSPKFGGFYMFSKPSLMIIELDLIKNILTKDFEYFHDRRMYYDEENDPLSAHLVALRGQRWKTSRAKITPTFTSGKMKKMFNIILSISEEVSKIIPTNESIDIKDLFARLSTDIIGSCAFGIDCNSLANPDTEFRIYGKKVFEFHLRDVLFNATATVCPKLLKWFKIPQTSPEVTNFFINVLKETIDYRETNKIERNDFLNLLIRLKNNQSVLDDDDEKISDDGITFNELAAHAFIFFFAGFETTSSTLNFCLFELVQNEHVQDKLREEIFNMIKTSNGQITYEGIMENKYLNCVIQEVLRKYPPIPMLARECTKDYNVPNENYTIKKGTDILISTLGIQRDPDYYPNPDKFDPERFSEEEKIKRHPFCYLPFGEGPRNCIGLRFALLQIKITLSVLLKEFKFKIDPKTVLPLVFDSKTIFLSPKHTIWLKAEKL